MANDEAREHYVFIPSHTVLSEEYKSLTPHTRQLYTYLILRRAGKDEWFSYSYTEIHEDSGYADKTITASIRALAREGFMKCKHGGLELNHNIFKLDATRLARS